MPEKEIVRLPGLTDIHVHLRVPGGEHKEDFSTGTRAAIAGGFTTVLAMPNTTPPLVSREIIHTVQRQAQKEALCDVHFYAGASPDHLETLPTLAQDTVGLKIYADQTYGPLRVENLATLLACFQKWPRAKSTERTKPIAMHAEERTVAIGIALAAVYGQHVHICHVSRKDEITLIAAAKARGLPVTCEVTPHHLFLTEADAQRLGPLGDMRPRLATQTDVNALWAHLDTTIDCIATDHAPHTLIEKRSPNMPPGVPGLETALPLMLTAVTEGRLSMQRLLDLMAYNPRRIFGLPEQPETWIDIDLKTTYTLSDKGLHTKCGWSPFSGMTVRGKVRRTHVRGHLIFQDDVFFPIQRLF